MHPELVQRNLLTADGFKLLQNQVQVHLLEGACWAKVKGLKLGPVEGADGVTFTQDMGPKGNHDVSSDTPSVRKQWHNFTMIKAW